MDFRITRAAVRLAAFLPPLTLACGLAQAEPADEALWQLRLRSDRHSDVLTLRDVKDEVYEHAQPRGAHNLVYLEEEARLERQAGAWHLGLLARSSATLVLNRDAVEVVAQASGAPAQGDRRWQTSARLRGFSGVGVEAGQGFVLNSQWRAGWSAQVLALTRLMDRRIDGPVDYTASLDRFDFDLRSHEANDHLHYPFQKTFSAHGAGLLLGGELGWQGDGLDLLLSFKDAGWLRWDRLPQQDATLSTHTQERDADGFLIYKPLVQGQNSQPLYSTRWPARWALRGSWQARPDMALSASLQTIPGFGVLPAVAVRQQWSGGLQTTLGWRFHERRASAALAWKGWQLEAGADRLGSGAHSRLLGLSYTTSL